jgi:SAM-dependent methyltransferase
VGETATTVLETCPLCDQPAPEAEHTVFVKDGFRIVRCANCTLLRRSPVPTDEELLRIYDGDYFREGVDGDPAGYLDYLRDEELHRLNARKRLRLLERHVAPGSLLDVGCAAGFFVDEARRRGWDVNGIDLSGSMTSWGRAELGLPLQTGPFSSAALPDGSLDLVTMWDYVEHSRDPLTDVAQAAGLLRPGGVLALSTGDAGSLVAKASGRRWHLLTPRHHLFYFTRQSLHLLASKAGLEVISARWLASRYSVRYLAHKARSAADVAPIRILASQLDRSRLGAVAVPVNLYDILTVLARKPDPVSSSS